MDFEKECNVCLRKRDVTFALIPCGHAGLCATCGDKIGKVGMTCPVCRRKIEGKMRIFF